MANPEHVEIVKQGVEAIAKWRKENPDVRLDLVGADLREANLLRADLREANLAGAHLAEAHLNQAHLDHAHLVKANLFFAHLPEANLNNANLAEALLAGVHLDGANLTYADLHGANLTEANLRRAHLDDACLVRADLHRANLTEANLTYADLHGANLTEADLGGAILQGVRGASHAYYLETVRLSGVNDAVYFELCHRPWPERWLDWERLRTVGRLPLFGISYTALILIPLVFYGLALYNRNIDLVHAWAKEAVTSPDHPLHRLAPHILEHLHRLPIPSLSFILLVSTILLAVASTLYTAFCPSRIKEFSRDQWCDQIGRSLLHYWPLAWKHRYIRLACAACYTLGGLGAAYVLGWKLWETGQFIWTHSAGPWPWR
jgi:uncharacterized protein YjbI with pentapeptide repeats